ncbi:MAG: HAD family hydrolase [Stagnimonas sp.]|nr:HAD family hydrolase [Stagnimonas sp.]
MRLAVFDLDHTLLATDSDYLWGQFLCDQGLVDRAQYEARNHEFYADYTAGRLDIDAFYRFSLAPLRLKTLQEWEPLRQRFVQEQIVPCVARLAPDLLARHRAEGDTLLITTATQRFITEPIAKLLGVEHLLASEPELSEGRFTGRLLRANFNVGKVTRLREWIAEQALPPEGITAYSDSRNDLPLLEMADRPVAVDPDPVLRDEAERRGWPVISLR